MSNDGASIPKKPERATQAERARTQTTPLSPFLVSAQDVGGTVSFEVTRLTPAVSSAS